MEKSYRQIYEEAVWEHINQNYVIHHIDFDRTNNRISNLVMLPKELHIKYHSFLQGIDPNWKTGVIKLCFYVSLGCPNLYISKDQMIEFYDVMSECQYWLEYRNLLLDNKRCKYGR